MRSGGHSNTALTIWAIQKLGEDWNDGDDEDDLLEDSSNINRDIDLTRRPLLIYCSPSWCVIYEARVSDAVNPMFATRSIIFT